MPAYTNAKQTIPEVFKLIMVNHAAQEPLLSKCLNRSLDALTMDEWIELGRLRREMIGYRADAERALKWNTDKGATV